METKREWEYSFNCWIPGDDSGEFKTEYFDDKESAFNAEVRYNMEGFECSGVRAKLLPAKASKKRNRRK